MLKLSELAQFLTNKLNEIAQSEVEKYDFLIHAEVGKNEPGKIGGILRTNEPTITPINGIENIMYNGSVKFAVPAPQSNFNLINIENIIGKFIETYNGLEVEFSNGKGLLTFTLARAEDYKIEYKTGEMLPLLFSVMVNYTENMITSATKVWQIKPLDDENAEFLTIPYLSESVLLEKSGKTNNISDALYQQTLLLSQIKFYRFEIPYETNDTLCSMLQKDILNGDFGKKYELRYYDGVSFLNEEGKDFRTTVSIYRTGDSGSRKPNTSIFNITFSDVDGGQNAIKYYMALVDNPFDSLSENTQYFESQAEQKTYFQTLINEGADYDEIPAPNLNSLYLTSQVYLNTRKYDIFNLINKNYAIIKATNDAGTFERFFFYVINNGDIGANGQVNYNLTMDTVQTLLFNDELEIQGSFINKAHLNRWIEVDENTVQFNGNYDSDLFEREELKEVAKRLVARKKLKYYSSVNPQIVDWLNENVLAWCYIIANVGNLKIRDMQDGSGNPIIDYPEESNETYAYYLSNSRISEIPYGYKLFCFPLLKNKDLIVNGNYTGTNRSYNVYLGYNGLKSFLKFTSVDFIYGIKLSLKPPIHLTQALEGNVDNNGNLILKGKLRSDSVVRILSKTINNVEGDSTIDGVISSGLYSDGNTENSQAFYGLFDILDDYSSETNFTLDLQLPKVEFDKEEITGVNGVGVNRDKKFNPKLNASDYKTLTLSFGGSTFDIDLQKVNRESIIFGYTEMITPDVTKGLLRFGFAENLNQNKKPIFNSDYADSFNGFMFSNDLSLPYSKNAYDTYMANNKNAYLSFQNQQSNMVNKAIIGKSGTLVNTILNPVNAINNLTNSLQDTANLFIDYNYNQTQFNLSMDNMKNAPDSLANANGNAIFQAAATEFGIYAEIYEGLDVEMEMANDIMFRDGYNYNRFGEVKDFINIRRYFNYVKATLGNISGVPISEEARRNLKQRFSTGIRFWNKNDNNEYVIDYTKENYERWLSPSQV